jgi:taurine dioxygenase
MGAEVRGLDLSEPLSDNLFQSMRQAWLEADGLLVFKDQHLEPEAQIAFSRRFGDLERHTLGRFLLPGHPEIYRVSTRKDEQGRPIGNDQAGRYWHSDLSYSDPPSLASLLHALEVPRLGGDTMFCNLYAAWEGLSAPMQAFLDGKRAVHDFVHVFRHVSSFRPEDIENPVPPVSQPVVRTHPETGRKALFVNPGFTTHIEGLHRRESDALLQMLFDHCGRPEYVYRHRWEVGDAVLWDNRCTLHQAVADFRPEHGPRHMHRTTVLGTESAY